jgi:hypothetical protein
LVFFRAARFCGVHVVGGAISWVGWCFCYAALLSSFLLLLVLLLLPLMSSLLLLLLPLPLLLLLLPPLLVVPPLLSMPLPLPLLPLPLLPLPLLPLPPLLLLLLLLLLLPSAVAVTAVVASVVVVVVVVAVVLLELLLRMYAIMRLVCFLSSWPCMWLFHSRMCRPGVCRMLDVLRAWSATGCAASLPLSAWSSLKLEACVYLFPPCVRLLCVVVDLHLAWVHVCS